MRYLLIGLFLIASLLFGLAVLAGPPDGLMETLSKTERDVMSRRSFGQAVGLVGANTTTTSSVSVDWGFTSNYVTVCLVAPTTTDQVVFMRLGSTNPATNEDDFIDGASNLVPGRAIPLSGAGDGTDTYCETHPWRTDGMTFFVPSFVGLGTVVLDATVDVSAH